MLSKSILTIVLLSAIVCHGSAFAQAEKLFGKTDIIAEAEERTVLGEEQAKTISLIRADKRVRTVKVVSINEKALLANSFSIVTPEGQDIVVEKVKSESDKSGNLIWRGNAGVGLKDNANFAIASGQLYGSIVLGDGYAYEIRSVGKNRYAFVQIDINKLQHSPKDAVVVPPPTKMPGGASQPSAKEKESADMQQSISGVPVVDVLVVYSPQAVQSMGDVNAFTANAVAAMNQSFANSQVSMSVRLVGAIPTPGDFNQAAYRDSLVAIEELAGRTQRTSLNQYVIGKRDALLADVVVMLGSYDICGRAYQGPATPELAFAVVDPVCQAALNTFSHEVAHILGADHNIQNAATVIPYAHGTNVSWYYDFKTAGIKGYSCWRTIMSFAISQFSTFPPCNRDFMINYWSNPNIQYTDTAPFTTPAEPNQSFTAPTGEANGRNNARMLNENSARVSNFSFTALWPTTGAVRSANLYMMMMGD